MFPRTVLADDATPDVDRDRRGTDFAMRGEFFADRLAPDGLNLHDSRTGVIIIS
jgi:hypothetical protein